MHITFDKIMPFPLASIKHGDESIWGHKVVLEPGKHILLNASSGKGKSTFTTTLFGLRNDYEGIITYNDKDIRTFNASDWSDIRSRKISVVFQDLQLFPNLTVRENLVLKNNLTHTCTEEQLREKLELLNIADKWEQRCGLLSMGQQQRVAIVRALSQPFEWLIMDEPFSHLDEVNSQRCLELIDRRCREINAGFVLTTLGDNHNYTYDYELKL